MEHVLDEIATPLDFLRFLSLAKMHAFAVPGPMASDRSHEICEVFTE